MIYAFKMVLVEKHTTVFMKRQHSTRSLHLWFGGIPIDAKKMER